jgi:mannose-6-phosphate isomerase-like protein (cupin superfamily)
MSIEVVDANAGQTISLGPMTLRILEDGSHTDHRLGVVELKMPPHVSSGPPQHVHRNHDETFFIISGTPTFTCGAQTITAQPGMLVTAPPGTPHTFANPGDQPAVLLCTITPDLYIDYFRELASLRPGPNGLDPNEVGQVMARYATEVVSPSPQDPLTSGATFGPCDSRSWATPVYAWKRELRPWSSTQARSPRPMRSTAQTPSSSPTSTPTTSLPIVFARHCNASQTSMSGLISPWPPSSPRVACP